MKSMYFTDKCKNIKFYDLQISQEDWLKMMCRHLYKKNNIERIIDKIYEK